MTMLAVAALVYKIWGGAVLFCTAAACGVGYALFYRQIHWILSSNDWIPSALRSMAAPILAFFGGPIGAAAAGVMTAVSYVGEQWNIYDQRRILERANWQLGLNHAALRRQSETWRQQVEQSQRILSDILQKSPELSQRLGGLDQNAEKLEEVRIKIEADQATLVQFLEYYRKVLGDSQVLEQISAVARVEGQMARLNAQLEQYNKELSGRIARGKEVAELQSANLETSAQLIVALQQLIQGLTNPAQ